MNKKDELILTFNELRAALQNNDSNKLSEIISEEYKGISLHGTLETKADILNSFKPGGVILTDYNAEETEFEISDNLGIFTGKGFVAGRFQEFVFEHHVLFTDIFKYYDSGWKYYKSQVTEINPG